MAEYIVAGFHEACKDSAIVGHTGVWPGSAEQREQTRVIPAAVGLENKAYTLDSAPLHSLILLVGDTAHDEWSSRRLQAAFPISPTGKTVCFLFITGQGRAKTFLPSPWSPFFHLSVPPATPSRGDKTPTDELCKVSYIHPLKSQAPISVAPHVRDHQRPCVSAPACAHMIQLSISCVYIFIGNKQAAESQSWGRTQAPKSHENC